MAWNQKLKRWLVPEPPAAAAAPAVRPGIYHFQCERDGAFIRFHLRVDGDGCAMLIAAAAEAVRLSPPGAAAAQALLEGATAEDAASRLGTPDARAVVEEVREAIDQLGRPDVRFPIVNLTGVGPDSRPARLLAPFQADVVPGTAADSREILSRLWDAGVFHVRALPQDEATWDALPELVEYAEDLGMIIGIRAFAGRLVNEAYVARLAAAGLDYVVVPWAAVPEIHAEIYGEGEWERLNEAVRIVRGFEVTSVLETPLLVQTMDALSDPLGQLETWDVANLEVFAVARREQDPAGPGALQALPGHELRQAAAWIEDLAEERGLAIAWLPPVAAPADRSIAAIAKGGPRAAGDLAIRVEASGEVLAARGPRRPVGNLLKDSWETIWQAEVFHNLREGQRLAERCDACPGMAVCDAGCPADPNGWAATE